MTNPTSNYGWQMPTNSDLVTDLPADFEVFGQAVDTSLADLKGGTTGQVLSKASNTDMDFTWVTDAAGDITGVTATSPLTGGGTSGDVTIGILSGTTSNLGAVQLSTSTSSTSTSLAATASAVKSAYDLADAAIAKSTLTTAGDTLYRNATVPTRLGIGTAGQVLTVNSGATAPEWATPSGSPTSYGYTAGKNKIINGDLSIWQRGTSFTNPALYSYTADRFQSISNHSGGTLTVSRQSFTAGTAPVAGYESSFFIRIDSAATTGSSVNVIGQPIEDVRTFAGQSVTVSFWAKASVAGNFSASLTQSFGSGGSGAVATSVIAATAATTSWVRYTGTTTLPSISGKTIGTGSSLALEIYMPINGTFSFDVWGVQVEGGSLATYFATASGGSQQAELAMCQRYYWRSALTSAYAYHGNGQATSTTATSILINNPVPMRVAATSVDFSNLGITDAVSIQSAITGITIPQGSNLTSGINTSGSSGLTQYRPYFLVNQNSTSGYIGFSAEL